MTIEPSSPDENPYEPPTTEKVREISSRSPSTLAWVIVILGAIVASGVVFFFTCFGVFMIGIQVDSAIGGRAQTAVDQWLPMIMLSVPFIAFFATFYFIVRAFHRSNTRSKQRTNKRDFE